jgi:hypothetical protein
MEITTTMNKITIAILFGCITITLQSTSDKKVYEQETLMSLNHGQGLSPQQLEVLRRNGAPLLHQFQEKAVKKEEEKEIEKTIR